MKWSVLALLAGLAALPATVSAQTVIPIGDIPKEDSKATAMWGQSEHVLFYIHYTDGDMTPIMRARMLDARTVEILYRTQAPKLESKDIHLVSKDGHACVTVRQYLLIEVKEGDARAANTNKFSLANQWADSVRRVFPAIAPQPSRFGI